MRKTRTELIPTEITTYGCDLCDFETENNTGCCGSAPIMVCDICKKDVCGKHRNEFEEGGCDYVDWRVCDECYPVAKEVWDEAIDTAGRHDSIYEVCKKLLKERTNVDKNN